MNFPKNSSPFTCDFSSLYTEINLTKALNKITDYINRHLKSDDITTIGFHIILELIFENNIFKDEYEIVLNTMM